MTTTRTVLLAMAVTHLAGAASAQISAGGEFDVYDANDLLVGRYLGISFFARNHIGGIGQGINPFARALAHC